MEKSITDILLFAALVIGVFAVVTGNYGLIIFIVFAAILLFAVKLISKLKGKKNK